MKLFYGPLHVYDFRGPWEHHLASLGEWRLALLVAETPDINGLSWRLPGKRTGRDQSPLMVAVKAQRPVGRGADGRLEWEYALGDGELAHMVRAAVAMGANVNRRMRRAWPLMSYCTKRGCVEAVKACLAAGAEVDARGGDEGWQTAVAHAGYEGHEELLEVLLEAGASASVGWKGEDETLAAVCWGSPTPGIVRRLVEAGADVKSRDMDGTAFMRAAFRGNLGVMKVFKELGVDVAAKDGEGMTAMQWTSSGEVVRWLATRGVSVQGDEDGDSPLHHACCSAAVNAVRAMIELGADVNARGKFGRTPLHSAAGIYNQEQLAA